MIEDLAAYWPLTLRQIYYRLVAAGSIANNSKAYRKLSGVLVKARLDGVVPWEAMEDRSRSTLNSSGWSAAQSFVETELEGFLAGYRRDLLQTQDSAIEVWVEKDTLSQICHAAALPYCVPVVVARGFASISYVHELRQRIEANTAAGYASTTVLYFGDLDPSGWCMLPSMMQTLQEEMGLGDQVVPRRCALTPDQVGKYDLPSDPDGVKMSDPRAARYIEEFGSDALAVEIDALPPATLQAIVRASIEQELNLITFRAEQARGAEEEGDLAELKGRVEEFMGVDR